MIRHSFQVVAATLGLTLGVSAMAQTPPVAHDATRQGPEHEHHSPKLTGPGVSELDHRLRQSEAGSEFVLKSFAGSDGSVTHDEAEAANKAFGALAAKSHGHVNDYALRSYRR